MSRLHVTRWSSARRSRGALMLGMAALVFVLGTICGTILLRSLDTYHAAARTEMRFQARAAVEGAVVVLKSSRDDRHEPLEIGSCKVQFGAPDSAGEQLSVPVQVSVARGKDRVVMEKSYIVRFDQSTSSTRHFVGLEVVR